MRLGREWTTKALDALTLKMVKKSMKAVKEMTRSELDTL